LAATIFQVPGPWRELIMVAMAVLSIVITDKSLRTTNKFTWSLIIEVATLFIGIFITMKPLLMLLEAKGSALGVVTPLQYFWISGGLSSFLDNAPTYVTFFSLAESVTKGLHLAGPIIAGVNSKLLAAISCGAVFMGANTYIGNGPNFMVKSIAEEQGVKMPSFFGYCAYSLAILIPLFLLIGFIFFI
jgi:Na+/H+ antiporter NhaD/arsenite permease-like protein